MRLKGKFRIFKVRKKKNNGKKIKGQSLLARAEKNIWGQTLRYVVVDNDVDNLVWNILICRADKAGRHRCY